MTSCVGSKRGGGMSCLRIACCVPRKVLFWFCVRSFVFSKDNKPLLYFTNRQLTPEITGNGNGSFQSYVFGPSHICWKVASQFFLTRNLTSRLLKSKFLKHCIHICRTNFATNILVRPKLQLADNNSSGNVFNFVLFISFRSQFCALSKNYFKRSVPHASLFSVALFIVKPDAVLICDYEFYS